MRQFQYLKIPFASTELFHSASYGSGTCIDTLKDKEEGVEGGGDAGCLGGGDTFKQTFRH